MELEKKYQLLSSEQLEARLRHVFEQLKPLEDKKTDVVYKELDQEARDLTAELGRRSQGVTPPDPSQS